MNPMADEAIAILHNAQMHQCDSSPSGYAVSIHIMLSMFLISAVKVDLLAGLSLVLQQHHFEFHTAADTRLM